MIEMTLITQLESIEQKLRDRQTEGGELAASVIANEIKRRKGIEARRSPLSLQERRRINSRNYRLRQQTKGENND